jgi:transposase
MTQQSLIRPLLALPDYFRITDIEANGSEQTAALRLGGISMRPVACCPLCQRPSRRVHSHYVRTLADLPSGGPALSLNVTVRRFFCGHPHCPRRVFAERLPDLTQPHARRTRRQRDKLQEIGLATGGRAGARLADALGMPISFKTLLRLVLASPCPECHTPRVLGVDDWAFRKGHRYGTILYDLETHQPVDLLPERTAESLAAWLKVHPGVEILSRDRASVYSEGARLGAPKAVEVADRFHLVKNLGEAFERFLHGKPHVLQPAAKTVPPQEGKAPESMGSLVTCDPVPPSSDAPPATVTLASPTKAQRDSQDQRSQRYLRYEQVRALQVQWYPISQIAVQMQWSRKTVRPFLQSETFPERAPRTGDSSQLDRHKPFLQPRWQEGCHNARPLWEELQAHGYSGGYTTVKDSIKSLRPSGVPPGAEEAKIVCGVRDVVTAVLRRDEQRTPEQQARVQRRDVFCEPFRRFHRCAQQFLTLVRSPKDSDQTAALREGGKEATDSEIGELRSFAAGIERDQAAVVAGLSLPWNNGAVEGSVNRLKMIKRQMFCRAGFALLRRRVVEPS